MPAGLNGRNVVMPATSYSNSWTTSVDGTGVKVGKTFTIPAPGGRSAEARIASKLTGPLVLGIGARALATAAPWAAAGMAVYDIYNSMRVHPDGSGGLLLEPGQPSQTKTDLVWGHGLVAANVLRAPTPAAAAADYMSRSCKSSSGCSTGGVTGCTKADAYGFSYQCAFTTYGLPQPDGTRPGPFTTQVVVQAVNAQITFCPAVIDPFDPAYSVIGGKPGADGKCPTGRGTAAPIDPDTAAAHAAAVARLPEVYKQMMDEVLGREPVPIPKGAQTQVETVTPSKVNGPVTTTTSPEGTIETATGWDFGRISQDLADDFNAGRWNETTTKTTTKPDGTKSTETTKEEGTTPQEESLKDGDPCKVDPGRLGCIGLGEAPKVDIPKTTKNVDLSREDIGGASGCPAPRAIGRFGLFSFDSLCDGLVKVKPLIILLGLFASSLIVVNALRA